MGFLEVVLQSYYFFDQVREAQVKFYQKIFVMALVLEYQHGQSLILKMIIFLILFLIHSNSKCYQLYYSHQLMQNQYLCAIMYQSYESFQALFAAIPWMSFDYRQSIFFLPIHLFNSLTFESVFIVKHSYLGIFCFLSKLKCF